MGEGSSVASDIVWEGRPWVLPGLVGATIEAVVLAVLLTWLELTFFTFGFPLLLLATYALIGVFWVVTATRLEIEKVSNAYVLRLSSLEVRHGILGKRMFTVSAAGFSDLEVTKTLAGRVLNVGTILIETDSSRDIRLLRIHDPVRVASTIRETMTVPVVRVAGEPPVPNGLLTR